jgi:protein tyrosine/serine phosphatase
MYCRASPNWVRWVLLAVLLALAIMGCRSALQSPVRTNAVDLRRIHPTPGTTIVRFEQIDDAVYRGSKPKSDADYEFLRSKNIKFILNLRFFPFLSEAETQNARRHQMIPMTATISASPVQPTERHINQILCLLRDERFQPIYFHCDLGRDRASLIAALYEVYFRGVSREKAWQRAEQFGFKGGWTLRGLKAYFDEHTQAPISRYVPNCSASR